MSIIRLYQRMRSLPMGRRLFSWAVRMKAPYFNSVRPYVESMGKGEAVVTFPMRRAVQNHIGTVHVIAICNGLEMAMGMVTEATIPKHLRWLPKSMHVTYPAKSETQAVRCIATVDPDAFKPDSDVLVSISAERDDGVVVVEGTITLWVTAKPQRK